MESGHVILLNGTSSSGKTSIARALQEWLTEPYMNVSVDGFFNCYPEKFLNPRSREEAQTFSRLIPSVVSGLHGSVAALADAGNNMIVDHVLEKSEWLNECVERWAGLTVLFVGVRCPLEIAEQRETARGDRNMGTARHQYDRVHAHGLYDLEVDTSLLKPDECAAEIIAAIDRQPAQSAFRRLIDRRHHSPTAFG
ncbi:MAG: chloramphenicol phosphotransferase [Chlorobi bacterium]|nr:chloramphenicol phosphotransferase [Chlorobiota bacterium]